jgi:hypothetical protein
MHPREHQRWNLLAQVFLVQSHGPAVEDLPETATSNVDVLAQATPIEASHVTQLENSKETLAGLSVREPIDPPADVSPDVQAEAPSAPAETPVFVRTDALGPVEAAVDKAECLDEAASVFEIGSTTPAEASPTDALGLVVAMPALVALEPQADTTAETRTVAAVAPVVLDLQLLSAGEFFALLPFDGDGSARPQEAPLWQAETSVADISALRAGDFFAAAVPWETSASPRAELGNLLALATRDAVGRAKRFSQPVAPSITEASAARFFQNLDWQGAKAHAS